jgi:conjugative relaxase-like TrwC/TraI family protein
VLNIGRLGADAAEYYLGEVASSPDAYYTGAGESPGRWVGSLSPALGLAGEVAPADLRAVLAGVHPITGEQLVVRQATGATGPPQRERLPLHDEEYDTARAASRLRLSVRQVQRLLWAGERVGADTTTPYLIGERGKTGKRGGQIPWVVRRSELERFEAASAPRRGRTGFDLTIRPPKSVSLLWALAPDDVRTAIREAHRESVDAVIAHLERHALVSRRWHGDWIETVGADGFVAAAFDHRTSRAGDPLLHTHVVTANLTRTIDGKWRALDARPIYQHARPAGVLYQAHLRRLLTERLGIEWEDVRNGWAEIAGVPSEVIRAFSKRRDEIEELVAEAGYGSARAMQAATLASRKPKQHAEAELLLERWRDEAAAMGFGPDAIAACLGRSAAIPVVHVDALLDELGSPGGLTKHASTFSRPDVVEAIAERSGAALRIDDIEILGDRFLASGRAVPVAAGVGAELVRRRGDALERDVDRVRFTTPDLIAMEDEIIRWAGEQHHWEGSFTEPEVLGKVLEAFPLLSDEQVAMVRALATGSGAITGIAGRPGAGKTTATAAYVAVLTAVGRPVLGCSVAATAAAELERACGFGPRTGRPASTVARLLIELERRSLPAGAVVVVDEASMVGTRDLHRLAAHTTSAGGTLVLVGDPDQHGAVETGGAFRALVERDKEGLTLMANNRQIEPRDRRIIELFREGNVEAALSRYDDAGLVVRSATASASYDRMVEDWWSHTTAGGRDPMIVGTNHGRRELNDRARACLVRAGLVSGPKILGADESPIAAGDWIVARRNDGRIVNGKGEGVLNGDVGRVTDVDDGRGTLAVNFERLGAVTLPPEYVSAHVQHAYARTTYGVQGATLDRAFVHVDDRTGFEEAYVAMTRGRTETRLYLVDGTALPQEETSHQAHVELATGLDTVAESMRQRRAGVMVHDIDPHATAVLSAGGSDLATLRKERRRLEAILRDGPADVSEALREAVTERDKVSTRLAAHSLRDTEQRAPLEESLRRHENRLNVVRRRHKLRQEFLDDHQAEVTELQVLRRAELAREVHVRATARISPPEELAELLGRDPIADRAVADAAEALAVHAERYGLVPDDPGSLLGSPPMAGEARMSYERVEQMLRLPSDDRIKLVVRDATPSLFD